MKSKTIKKLIALAGVGLILVIALIITVKLFIVPAIVGYKITAAIEKRWNGNAKIKSIDFSYSKPIVIKGLTLADTQKRKWVFINRIEATILGLKTANPTVSQITMDNCEVTYHPDAQLDSLIKPDPDPNKPTSSYVNDINEITIDTIIFSAQTASEKIKLYDNLNLTITKNQNLHDIILRSTEASFGQLHISGSANVNEQTIYLTAKLNRIIDRPTSQLFTAMFDRLSNISFTGNFDADIQISTSMKNPAPFPLEGPVHLSYMHVYYKNNLIATKAAADISLHQNAARLNSFTADAFTGTLSATADILLDNITKPAVKADFHAIQIDLPQAAKAFEFKKEFKKGKLILDAKHIRNDPPNELPKTNLVFWIDDTDIGSFPLAEAIFKFMTIPSLDPMQSSDIAGVVRIEGDIATIDQARIANVLGAVHVEPGGTANIKSEELDLYAVAVPLNEITDFMKKLPVIGSFVDLKEKLTRVRIKGNWNDDPSSLISKQPLDDIQEGTIDFFKDIAKTPGQIGSDVLDKFRSILGWGDGSDQKNKSP